MSATTTTPTTADRVLLALHESENGALTDLAIREQIPNGMRAVPALVRQGAVTTVRETCWVETDNTRMEQREVTTVRLKRTPTPTATVEHSSHLEGGFTVRTTWDADGLDRTDGIAYSVGYDRNLADRIADAINDGVLFRNPNLATDVDGRTYVKADPLSIGKYANQDLAAIGR